MYELNDILFDEYLDESRGQLANVETDMLVIEKGGEEIDEDRINCLLQVVRKVKAGSIFFNLSKIGELAQQTENVLGLIRSGKMRLAPDRVRVLRWAIDRLNELIQDPDASDNADVSELMAELSRLYADHRSPSQRNGAPLRFLLVEDDFVCRLLLQTFLSRYGECHIAVNGKEAVEAFQTALDLAQGYDLICMDIMMPVMDGREAVRQVRALEEVKHIRSTEGTKIFMTTTVQEVKSVSLCFKELCDAYLVKPIDLGHLLRQMKLHQILE